MPEVENCTSKTYVSNRTIVRISAKKQAKTAVPTSSSPILKRCLGLGLSSTAVMREVTTKNQCGVTIFQPMESFFKRNPK